MKNEVEIKYQIYQYYTMTTKRDVTDEENKIEIVKPFLKWVGGKTQIIEKLMAHYPMEMNNYHDIFLGGGSTLLALLSYVKHNRIVIRGKIYAYDYNETLINVFINVQKHEHRAANNTSFFIIR